MTLFRMSRTAAFAMALAIAAGAAIATTGARAASPDARVVEIPPGAVVLILPAGGMPDMAPGMMSPDIMGPGSSNTDDGLPAPDALLRHVDAMMQRAFGGMAVQPAFAGPTPDQLIEAAMRQMQSGESLNGAPMHGFMVTTVSNGRETCTRQVTYSGSQAAPKVDVRMTGNACGTDSTPAASPAPDVVPAARPIARTLRVERTVKAPIQVAQLDR